MMESFADSLIPKLLKDGFMKGTRPLNNNEIRQVTDAFDGIYAVRNRALFVLGVSTG